MYYHIAPAPFLADKLMIESCNVGVVLTVWARSGTHALTVATAEVIEHGNATTQLSGATSATSTGPVLLLSRRILLTHVPLQLQHVSAASLTPDTRARTAPVGKGLRPDAMPSSESPTQAF